MAAAYDLLLLQITPTFLLDEDDKRQIIRMLTVHSTTNQMTTRMWANAQPDGRPAEHRWRPLFNAAKFGSRPPLDAVQ